MWLPSQYIDAPVAAGGGKAELHIKLARNLQEDRDAGETHLQRDSNTPVSLEPQPLPEPRSGLASSSCHSGGERGREGRVGEGRGREKPAVKIMVADYVLSVSNSTL